MRPGSSIQLREMGFLTQRTLSTFVGRWTPFVGPEREIKETIKGEIDCNPRIREGNVNLGKEEIGLSQSWNEGPQVIRQIKEI